MLDWLKKKIGKISNGQAPKEKAKIIIPVVKTIVVPKIGETWELIPTNGSPFFNGRNICKIIDTKLGWVQYRIGQSFILWDKEVKEFMTLYRKSE